MNTPSRVIRPIYGLLPLDVEGFDSLTELALDTRWSWNPSTDEVWRMLDPTLWEITQNPWVVLQTVSRDRAPEWTGNPCAPLHRSNAGPPPPI